MSLSDTPQVSGNKDCFSSLSPVMSCSQSSTSSSSFDGLSSAIPGIVQKTLQQIIEALFCRDTQIKASKKTSTLSEDSHYIALTKWIDELENQNRALRCINEYPLVNFWTKRELLKFQRKNQGVVRIDGDPLDDEEDLDGVPIHGPGCLARGKNVTMWYIENQYGVPKVNHIATKVYPSWHRYHMKKIKLVKKEQDSGDSISGKCARSNSKSDIIEEPPAKRTNVTNSSPPIAQITESTHGQHIQDFSLTGMPKIDICNPHCWCPFGYQLARYLLRLLARSGCIGKYIRLFHHQFIGLRLHKTSTTYQKGQKGGKEYLQGFKSVHCIVYKD
ncbi:hypothetical protein SERLA73DRAFT_150256 [Serpula lacrymans var. lacrymans S7.3]|uniref:Uncharacterized protein n=1 Tax=Serpula lacrymans var. lacrymans (strain S7.3) TaxID=936435 RepID=F8PLS6_SERL3|nr:hypothetical protein SERLA73DRAFT_150256 [Serpula lacrymans var. lacrymans S7.3]